MKGKDGKDGKDGQNGEISNNFSLLFYHVKVSICFSGTNELQFVFRTGKDGRDGINGDVPIFLNFDLLRILKRIMTTV